MRNFLRRRFLSHALASGALAVLATGSRAAQADLFGGDVAVLTGILTESIAQVANLANMLIQIANQVRMMTTLLQQVGSGSFPALISFINAARFTYGSLTSGIQSMSYKMARIDADYQKLFPPGEPPTKTSVAQHRAQYVAWNQEVVGASQIAARQETSLSTLDDHAAQTKAVLDQSKAASGVVEELQLIAQLIGITNQGLVVLNQTLATTSRVLTDMAARSASEHQLSLGKSDDARAGYTDKGAPVVVPRTLP
jgi:P-type conjugative transfer protein TrbJ